MLRPASRPAHDLLWLLPVTFIKSNQDNPSHATITKIWIGVNLEIVFFVELRAPCSRPIVDLLKTCAHREIFLPGSGRSG